MMNITKVTTTTIITNPTTRMETKEVCLGTMMGVRKVVKTRNIPEGTANMAKKKTTNNDRRSIHYKFQTLR